MKAIRVHQHGGPDVLVYEDVERPEPGPGQVRVKIIASGLNYIDTYHREGLYSVQLPITPGVEGAGLVDASGPGVDLVRPGDRVAYALVVGSYAQYAVVPADKLVPLPDGVDFRDAAAAMIQGITAHYLAHSTYKLGAGDTALVHAAAGGVGLLLVQVAKRCGATVLGTVSTEDKAQLAQQAGADAVIRYTEVDFEDAVMELTGGRGVDVVYDSVGRDTFERSFNCLRPRGLLALFGQSSGPVPPIDLQILNQKGSLYVTRPTMHHYVGSRTELLSRATAILDWIQAGDLAVRIDRALPLAQAAEAHRLLQGRKTAGKVLLIP